MYCNEIATSKFIKQSEQRVNVHIHVHINEWNIRSMIIINFKNIKIKTIT